MLEQPWLPVHVQIDGCVTCVAIAMRQDIARRYTVDATRASCNCMEVSPEQHAKPRPTFRRSPPAATGTTRRKRHSSATTPPMCRRET